MIDIVLGAVNDTEFELHLVRTCRNPPSGKEDRQGHKQLQDETVCNKHNPGKMNKT